MKEIQLQPYEKIQGHIYCIHNKINNKKYIGQTVSHRKYKNTFKEFGELLKCTIII
jgi:hypothetical protein